MARLRFIVILLAVWLILLFNIERWHTLGINPPGAIYLITAIAIMSVLAFPGVIAIRWPIVLGLFVVVYTAFRFQSAEKSSLPLVAVLLPEWALIAIGFTVARLISSTITNVERTYDTLIETDAKSRILKGLAGEEVINQELFRARRYDRPVSLIYIKTPSLRRLERIYEGYLPYQISLQQRYMQLRTAQLAESLLYSSDPISWYIDDVVICLPETEEEQARELAHRIATVLHTSLNFDLPLGIAVFPEQGLIFDDLVEHARNNLHYVVGDQLLPVDDTIPVHESLSVAGAERNHNRVNGHQPKSSMQEEPSPFFRDGLLERGQSRLRQWYRSLEHDASLLPPEAFPIKGLVNGKPFYNPDFWVNRLPHQTASGRELYSYVKRVMDIAAVLLASPFLLLLFATVGFFIWLEDRGPIFYSQPRTGVGGHEFRMYKFRSMVPNADAIKKELGISTNMRGETVDQHGNKLENDPRVTRIGNIIRKTSIDELPQLWNVIRGDMSLVGPRPTSYGVDKYTLFQTERLSVKPGLTGLWQVYDRNDTDFDNRLIWDIRYIDRMSLWLDIQILLRTVLMQVVKRKGA
jgi:lipopolysaccharide/colanic/teichoic acid biosynthesis glycosyltransferase